MTISLQWFQRFMATVPVESDEEDLAEAGLMPNNPSWEAQNGTRASLLSLLRYYERPGITPPFSRVDPSILQQDWGGIGLLWFWKYGTFLASKGIDITKDILSHFIYGPRRPSWGIEMTIITSFMRNANRHSQLTDLTRIRFVFQLSGYIPVPPSALVTPVTFRIHKRRLRGILSGFDARENGTRELFGEWIISKHLWHRLQAEWTAARHGRQRKFEGEESIQRFILYLHGGAYYVASAASHRFLTIPLSKFTEARVLAIDYRLAPETRFPGPLHDAVSAYFRLIGDLHIPPQNIFIAGDSAGGGLTLALLMYLRDNGYPMPAGAILMSPWVDLTLSCESWDSNADVDILCLPKPGDHLDPVACYLGQEGLKNYLTHPYASPLFGNFDGLPPLLIQCGDAEVLRDEITLLAHKAASKGVDVRHEIFQDAVHVFQAFPYLESSHKAFLSCRRFIREIVSRRQAKPPTILDSPMLEGETRNINSRVVRDDGEEAEIGQLSAESESLGTDSERFIDSDDLESSLDHEHLESSAPPPMVRTGSHPDLATLCREWARGPANHTIAYKA